VIYLLYKGLLHLNSLVPIDCYTLILYLSKELVFLSLEAAYSAKVAVFNYSLSVGVSWDTLGEPTVTISSAIIVHDTLYTIRIRPIRLGILTVY